jgi:hypothetical protein
VSQYFVCSGSNQLTKNNFATTTKEKKANSGHIADASYFDKSTSLNFQRRHYERRQKMLIFPKLLLTLFLTIFTIPLSQRE